METLSRLLKSTKTNLIRNKWLSLSTIFVISIVFTISASFIGLAIIGQKTVSYYEKKAQVIVFFKKEAPEAEIFKFRDKINDSEIVENIEYVSKEQALEIYKQDFEDDPDLVETITADTLPPSLNIRAKTIGNLQTIIKNINQEKERNAYVDEVFYFKDVLDNIKALSQFISYAAIILITGLAAISFSLIMVTIGFNILAHKNEIEIMHLVGSTDQYIRVPFILEGAFYGITGGIISSTLILLPWYLAMHFLYGSDFHYWVSQILNDLSLPYLKSFDPLFTLVFLLIQIGIGVFFGSVSSYFAVLKYLNLKTK
ncbi:MAG: hypothetical protein UT34_C0001G0065 [candidate division WS6 bacterium GW2011_GWF2_39_15]|uniref:Cell division protein FtsX n=1 Tax=candidate division WS6 bacterium GW2011_GWF2_39_15 TaxID=1619100 RepID=A0A0G0Q6H9_9BACT|nr:MAG: hypothetical protein UT34_C0001G0065 [candidate division WS6 bacterium GW2011_GWF2_39_15]